MHRSPILLHLSHLVGIFLHKAMTNCVFRIGGVQIEHVFSYTHLGHIITSRLDDADDILHRRSSYIGQVNNVVCYFDSLSWTVKLGLHKSYCSSIFGCELWALDSVRDIEKFCVAWRKGLRRVLSLPRAAHSHLLPLLSNSLPVYDEICKRSAKFIVSCQCSDNILVRAVVNYAIAARSKSVLGRNVMLLCRRFHLSFDDFVSGRLLLSGDIFVSHYLNSLSEAQLQSVCFALELLCLREQSFKLNNNMRLNADEISDYLAAVLC